MIRRPPRSTRTDTLSLHDALPISCSALAPAIASASAADAAASAAEIAAASAAAIASAAPAPRSEEHTSELQSLMRISYAVFCLKKKKTNKKIEIHISHQ